MKQKFKKLNNASKPAPANRELVEQLVQAHMADVIAKVNDHLEASSYQQEQLSQSVSVTA